MLRPELHVEYRYRLLHNIPKVQTNVYTNLCIIYGIYYSVYMHNCRSNYSKCPLTSSMRFLSSAPCLLVTIWIFVGVCLKMLRNRAMYGAARSMNLFCSSSDIWGIASNESVQCQPCKSKIRKIKFPQFSNLSTRNRDAYVHKCIWCILQFERFLMIGTAFPNYASHLLALNG